MTALRPAGRVVAHPARYSPELLDVLRFIVPRLTRVHDPFAGTGERLGRVASDRPWFFTGTEIEPGFIVDHRVFEGDSTDPYTYPEPVACGACGDTTSEPGAPCSAHVLRPYTIVTSPVYPNGMADHFVSKASDESTRRTYRHALADTVGEPEVELAQANMGRWGYRSATSLDNTSRMMYWHLARKAVGCWAGAERCIVNVSDFVAGDRQVPVVDGWERLLVQHGWTVDAAHPVATKRYKNGANRNARVEAELILDCTRHKAAR